MGYELRMNASDKDRRRKCMSKRLSHDSNDPEIDNTDQRDDYDFVECEELVRQTVRWPL